MNPLISLRAVAWCVAALLIHFTAAAANVLLLRPESTINAGGLQVSFGTSGYKFVVPSPTSPNEPPLPLRESFSASVLLYNRSNSDITFTFPDANAAARHFAFRVFDKKGDVVWESEAPSAIPVIDTDVTLGKRRSWQRSIKVPLKIDDNTWLSPGRYTLEAFINGTPQIGASTVFEVVLPDPARNDTGIEGVVYQQSSLPLVGDGPTPAPWPVKANLSITEIPASVDPTHPPFVWTGTTDDQGGFHVVAPPGRFKVTASRVPQVGDPTSPTEGVTIEVAVVAGKFSRVAILLPPGPYYPPPPAATGIRGFVVAPVGGPAAEQPLANAAVLVEEISQPVLRPRFRWMGTTSSEGRFQVATYPGRYRVTARQLTPDGVELGSTTAEVTVQEHGFTLLELSIDNGMVGPMAR